MDQQPDGGFRVDPGRALAALQRNTSQQFAQMHMDMAAKDAAIEQLAEENQMLRQTVDGLNQRIAELTAMEQDVVQVVSPPPSAPSPGNRHNGGVVSIPSGENVGAPTIISSPPGEPGP